MSYISLGFGLESLGFGLESQPLTAFNSISGPFIIWLCLTTENCKNWELPNSEFDRLKSILSAV